MNVEEYRDYCMSKKGVTESFPFDDKALVFKVMNKMFALVDVDNFKSTNLKCAPERAIDLRERYEAVQPGYHMNKKHWNTVSFNLDASDQLIFELIDHSYDLVVNSLTKKLKAELAEI